MSARLFSSLFVAVGLLVGSSTFLPGGSAAWPWVVRSLDSAAVLVGVAFVVLGRRVRPWALHVAVVGGVALVTGALTASGGGTTAVTYALVYLVPLYAFFIFTPRAATAHLAVAVAVGVPVLAVQPGVRPADQLVLWGVVVMQCVVIVWLVRSLAESEMDFRTGLVNRRGVERSLDIALTGRPRDRPLALALLDLDHFKTFNDDVGRIAGDRVLEAAALAWAPLVPPPGVLARWGGDVFALLLPARLEDAEVLLSAVREVLPVGTCSVGISLWDPEDTASTLVARAEAALHSAKRGGRDRVHVHSGAGTGVTALREALARGDFAVHFQPIVDVATGGAVGAEALVRWDHPDVGVVSPAEFLPEAERSGLIVELGEFVLRTAMAAARSWPVGACGQPMYVSVNASARELEEPGYDALVARLLREVGLAPAQLVVELVESDYDVGTGHPAANLRGLRTLGVRLAVDDFGVGYSSVDRLRRLGVDVLKIDQSFVREITRRDQDEPLVEAMLAMASALRMRVVAEGVETAEQHAWLRLHGCDYGQGYLFGRPAASPLRSAAVPAAVR